MIDASQKHIYQQMIESFTQKIESLQSVIGSQKNLIETKDKEILKLK
jgi:hypothetical protein